MTLQYLFPLSFFSLLGPYLASATCEFVYFIIFGKLLITFSLNIASTPFLSPYPLGLQLNASQISLYILYVSSLILYFLFFCIPCCIKDKTMSSYVPCSSLILSSAVYSLFHQFIVFLTLALVFFSWMSSMWFFKNSVVTLLNRNLLPADIFTLVFIFFKHNKKCYVMVGIR